MSMIFPKWIVDLFLRCTKETEKSCLKELKKDRHTENYKMPKTLKFSRPIVKNEYSGLEVFESPSDGNSEITLLYLHGGAYIHKFSIFHWKFLIEMAKKTGCALAVPNYLMLPKWTAKISNEITMNFYESFTKTHDMNKVIIAGDSAGGGLATVIIQRAIKMGLPIPQQAILLSPWVDVTGGNPKKDKIDKMISTKMAKIYGEAWQNGLKDKDPFASPLYGEMAGFPYVDLYLGGNEILYDDVISLYDKMRYQCVEVKLHFIENEGHVYPLYPTKNGQRARREIADLIKTKK